MENVFYASLVMTLALFLIYRGVKEPEMKQVKVKIKPKDH